MKEKKDIKLSVIIPIYGVEKFIERCAISLFEQTLKDGIEFIFVNDCSPDGSLDILNRVVSKYPNRCHQINIVSTPVNSGLAAARNLGFSHARGTYIAHCDSDDMVSPIIYEKMLEKALAEDSDIVVCDYIGGYRYRNIPYHQPSPQDIMEFKQMILDGRIHNGLWNKLIRRDLYDKLDFLWTDGVNMWEDVSVLDRLVYFAQKVAYVHAPLYFYNQTNTAAYTKSRAISSAQQIERAYNIVNDFYEHVPDKEMWADSIIKFRQRALFTILNRLPRTHRNEVINTFKVRPEDLIIPLTRPNKVLYNLYLSGKHRAADGFSKIISIIRSITR
ncbi:MAG: glycosyltransferase [Bacteroides sp.]|nr:glycosyltransferase [Bacteroides sp.]